MLRARGGRGINYVEPQSTEYYCELCDSQMNSEDMWERHVSGKKHLKNLEKESQLGSMATIRSESNFDAFLEEQCSATDEWSDFGDFSPSGVGSSLQNRSIHQSQNIALPRKHQNCSPTGLLQHRGIGRTSAEEIRSNEFAVMIDIPDRSRSDFYCHVCESHMNSEQMWRSHIAGKRHLKNVSKKPGEKKSKLSSVEVPNAIAVIERELNGIEEPLVGMEYMQELIRAHAHLDPSYSCFLCRASFQKSEVIDHMRGLKHKMEFLKVRCPEKYKMLSSLNFKKDDLKLLVEEAVLNHELMYPRGKMEVRMEKPKNSVFLQPNHRGLEDRHNRENSNRVLAGQMHAIQVEDIPAIMGPRSSPEVEEAAASHCLNGSVVQVESGSMSAPSESQPVETSVEKRAHSGKKPFNSVTSDTVQPDEILRSAENHSVLCNEELAMPSECGAHQGTRQTEQYVQPIPYVPVSVMQPSPYALHYGYPTMYVAQRPVPIRFTAVPPYCTFPSQIVTGPTVTSQMTPPPPPPPGLYFSCESDLSSRTKRQSCVIEELEDDDPSVPEVPEVRDSVCDNLGKAEQSDEMCKEAEMLLSKKNVKDHAKSSPACDEKESEVRNLEDSEDSKTVNVENSFHAETSANEKKEDSAKNFLTSATPVVEKIYCATCHLVGHVCTDKICPLYRDAVCEPSSEESSKNLCGIKSSQASVYNEDVLCSKCHEWGHVGTDELCPLFDCTPAPYVRKKDNSSAENVLGSPVTPKEGEGIEQALCCSVSTAVVVSEVCDVSLQTSAENLISNSKTSEEGDREVEQAIYSSADKVIKDVPVEAAGKVSPIISVQEKLPVPKTSEMPFGEQDVIGSKIPVIIKGSVHEKVEVQQAAAEPFIQTGNKKLKFQLLKQNELRQQKYEASLLPIVQSSEKSNVHQSQSRKMEKPKGYIQAFIKELAQKKILKDRGVTANVPRADGRENAEENPSDMVLEIQKSSVLTVHSSENFTKMGKSDKLIPSHNCEKKSDLNENITCEDEGETLEIRPKQTMINFAELRKKSIDRRKKKTAETLKVQCVLNKETVLSTEEIARKKIQEALTNTKHQDVISAGSLKEESKKHNLKRKQDTDVPLKEATEGNIWKSCGEKSSLVDSVFTKALQSMQPSVLSRSKIVKCRSETPTKKDFQCNACLELGRDHTDEDCPVLCVDVQCLKCLQLGHSYPDRRCSVFKEHMCRLSALEYQESSSNLEIKTTETDPKAVQNSESESLETKEGPIRCTECFDEGHTKDDPVCIYYSKPVPSVSNVPMNLPPLLKTLKHCNAGKIHDEADKVCSDCNLPGHFNSDNPRCLYYEKPSNAASPTHDAITPASTVSGNAVLYDPMFHHQIGQVNMAYCGDHQSFVRPNQLPPQANMYGSTVKPGFPTFSGICERNLPPRDDTGERTADVDEIAERVINKLMKMNASEKLRKHSGSVKRAANSSSEDDCSNLKKKKHRHKRNKAKD